MDAERFRSAMACLGSAVCVVATDGRHGRYRRTVSAVSSVSDSPPSLLVCVNRQSGTNAAIRGNGKLSVNVLGAHQQAVGSAFSTPSMTAQDRFAVGKWARGSLGNPVLEGAAARLDCQVDECVEYGSHTVFFSLVHGIDREPLAGCLVYHARDYHPVGMSE